MLKEKLFKDINSSYCFDSPFIQELVIFFRENLTNRDVDEQSRVLDIIEDLISNCGAICNEAFNNDKFCLSLQTLATTFHMTTIKLKEWGIIRSRAAGIILYLAKKYENEEPHYIFGKCLRTLYEMKANVPETTSIIEVMPK